MEHSEWVVWLEELYGQYYTMLYKAGMRLCKTPAQFSGLYDELQEVFVALWRKREQLLHHPNIGGWLVCALRLQLLARAQKGAKEFHSTAFSLDDENAPALRAESSMPAEPTEALLYQEKIEALESLLGADHAQLFLAYTLEGRSAKELATQYRLTEASVWMRISRMKKKIMEHPEIFSLLLFSLLGFTHQ